MSPSLIHGSVGRPHEVPGHRRARLAESRQNSGRDPHNAETITAQRTYRACGHCAPALRAGALLACPDAQRALHGPFLTSPPHHGTGEARSGTQQSASGQPSRAKPTSRSKSRSRSKAVWSASGLHLPRSARHTTAQPATTDEETHPPPSTRIVGLRPPAPRFARHPPGTGHGMRARKAPGVVNSGGRTS